MSNVGWRIKVEHDKQRVIFAKLFRSKEKDAAMTLKGFKAGHIKPVQK